MRQLWVQFYCLCLAYEAAIHGYNFISYPQHMRQPWVQFHFLSLANADGASPVQSSPHGWGQSSPSLPNLFTNSLQTVTHFTPLAPYGAIILLPWLGIWAPPLPDLSAKHRYLLPSKSPSVSLLLRSPLPPPWTPTPSTVRLVIPLSRSRLPEVCVIRMHMLSMVSSKVKGQSLKLPGCRL